MVFHFSSLLPLFGQVNDKNGNVFFFFRKAPTFSVNLRKKKFNKKKIGEFAERKFS